MVDTSGWKALLDEKDANHERAKAAWREILQQGCRLDTSDYICAETITLFRSRLGHKAAMKVGQAILSSGFLSVHHLAPEVWRRAWEIFQRRADKNLGFVDCTSFALMQHLGISHVFTFGKRFEEEGFQRIP
jgi:hypothetical protein